MASLLTGPSVSSSSPQHRQIFTQRLVGHWHSLPREVVDVPSLEMFKTTLDESLSNLIWWVASLPMVGGLELDDLSGSFQPKLFYDMI